MLEVNEDLREVVFQEKENHLLEVNEDLEEVVFQEKELVHLEVIQGLEILVFQEEMLDLRQKILSKILYPKISQKEVVIEVESSI